MVYGVLLGVRRNYDCRNPRTKEIVGVLRRRNMIIKAPEVIPCEHDGGALPVGRPHDGVDLLGDPVLPDTHAGWRMIALRQIRGKPAHARQLVMRDVFMELRREWDVGLPLVRVADMPDLVVGGPDVAEGSGRGSIVLPAQVSPIGLVGDGLLVPAGNRPPGLAVDVGLDLGASGGVTPPGSEDGPFHDRVV